MSDENGLSPEDDTRLAKLQAAGLFGALTDERIGELLHNEYWSSDGDDDLAQVVEQFVRGADDVPSVGSPQGANHLVALVPEAEHILRDDPDHKHVHLVRGDAAGTFEPDTHHAWAGIFNLALAALDDERRFVALPVTDFEEPLYLLVTPAQRDVIAEVELLAWDADEVEAPGYVQIETLATELVERLRRKGVAARAIAGGIELELDLAAAITLVERLRAAKIHDARVLANVTRALETVP